MISIISPAKNMRNLKIDNIKPILLSDKSWRDDNVENEKKMDWYTGDNYFGFPRPNHEILGCCELKEWKFNRGNNRSFLASIS